MGPAGACPNWRGSKGSIPPPANIALSRTHKKEKAHDPCRPAWRPPRHPHLDRDLRRDDRRRPGPCGRLVDALGSAAPVDPREHRGRSEEHTSELQSLMRISYAVFCLKQKNTQNDDI